jgi:hypothetical protein
VCAALTNLQTILPLLIVELDAFCKVEMECSALGVPVPFEVYTNEHENRRERAENMKILAKVLARAGTDLCCGPVQSDEIGDAVMEAVERVSEHVKLCCRVKNMGRPMSPDQLVGVQLVAGSKRV